MKVNPRIITAFVAFALLMWVLDIAVDYLFPHERLLSHVWFATGAVLPPFTILGLFALKALKKSRRVEKQLDEVREQLQRSHLLASLGQMTAGIAHEIGNPLAIIVLYSEAVLKGTDDPRQTKKDLKLIRDEAKRAGDLIKDLLAYSQKLEPIIGRVNANSVINKVVKMLRYQLKVQNIKITTDLLKGILNVNGDASQLTQVLVNLIMNAGEAVKRSKGSSIKVSSSLENGWVKIAVTDDGTGIPSENMDQIFLPFFTTKDIGEGTGLGLSMCYGIITAHGGTITAENNDDGGATFTLLIPEFTKK